VNAPLCEAGQCSAQSTMAQAKKQPIKQAIKQSARELIDNCGSWEQPAGAGGAPTRRLAQPTVLANPRIGPFFAAAAFAGVCRRQHPGTGTHVIEGAPGTCGEARMPLRLRRELRQSAS
jgi:hypothetical protein